MLIYLFNILPQSIYTRLIQSEKIQQSAKENKAKEKYNIRKITTKRKNDSSNKFPGNDHPTGVGKGKKSFGNRNPIRSLLFSFCQFFATECHLDSMFAQIFSLFPSELT